MQLTLILSFFLSFFISLSLLFGGEPFALYRLHFFCGRCRCRCAVVCSHLDFNKTNSRNFSHSFPPISSSFAPRNGIYQDFRCCVPLLFFFLDSSFATVFCVSVCSRPPFFQFVISGNMFSSYMFCHFVFSLCVGFVRVHFRTCFILSTLILWHGFHIYLLTGCINLDLCPL